VQREVQHSNNQPQKKVWTGTTRPSSLAGKQSCASVDFHPKQKPFAQSREAQSWAKTTESEMLRGVWRDQSEAENTTLIEALNRYAREISTLKKGATQEIYRQNQRIPPYPVCIWRQSKAKTLRSIGTTC
jgi:hypothetical protein